MAHASACLHPEVGAMPFPDLHGNEAAYSCASEHESGGQRTGGPGRQWEAIFRRNGPSALVSPRPVRDPSPVLQWPSPPHFMQQSYQEVLPLGWPISNSQCTPDPNVTFVRWQRVPALQRNSVLSGGATPTSIAIFDPTEVRLRTPFAPSHLRTQVRHRPE